MTEIDTNHASRFHVDHEVGEMAVSNTKNPVAHAQQGMRADEVGAQGKKGLRTVAHLQKCSPRNWQKQKQKKKKDNDLVQVASFITQIKRFNLLQEVTGHKLQHLRKVADSVGTFRFPGKNKTNIL